MVTIEDILRIAKEYNASDVHLTVGLPPKMRVRGSLVDMEFPKLSPAETDTIIKGMMNNQQLDTLGEKGEVDFSYSVISLGRYRVNAFRQRNSLAAAIRLVGTAIPRSETLGIPKSVIDLTDKKRGLVLVTGPTGSGKSTTLASLIDRINENHKAHIITLEDPIEYLHQHRRSMINQREVGTDTHSYANALRAALREDPDVILVGEMRDLETISIAVTAAETGHLVFSTLHTIGAASTIDRIIDVFPPHQQQQIRIQLSMVLEAVVSQQLLPTADGKRRVAAFEVMLMNTAIKNLVRENKTQQIAGMIQTNMKEGMITMDAALANLVKMGEISREVAYNFSIDERELRKYLMTGY